MAKKDDRKSSKSSSGRSSGRPSGRSQQKRKQQKKSVRSSANQQKTRQRRPITPERDEDMLSEFSDDTNTFYTDERAERRRREKEASADRKKAKKEEKRKPSSPMKRKLIRIISYAAIVTVVLVTGIVLSLTVLFKTQVYEVTGNTKYPEQDIIDASGIHKGENIFLAPKGFAEKRIKDNFPYIEEANVGFSIPDTITIGIVEAVEGYLVKVNSSDYLVISTKGRILDRVTDKNAYGLPIFIGPTPVSGEPGDYVSYEDSTVVTMIDSITQTFADNGYQGITEIDATNPADITFTYDNRIKIRLGIPEDLDYKIRTAMTIINEKLDVNQTGTIQGELDVSRCNTTKRSYFNEKEIAPTQPNTEPTQAADPNAGTDTGYSGDNGGEYYESDYSGDYSWEEYNSDWGYYDDSYSWDYAWY